MNILPISHQAEAISLDSILIADERRELNHESIGRLVESISRIGLQTPITVRDVGLNEYKLIVGRHRIEAYRQLGRDVIPAIVRDCDEIQAELWEIAENLHRAELTKLERAEQVARWIELTEVHLAQVEPNESRRADGRGHRTEGGVRSAARELGVERNEAHRSVKIASLSPDAKEEARVLGLDNNQGALLDAAKEETPEAQVESLKKHVRGTGGTGDNEWYTPRQYLDSARKVLGGIDLDPATSPQAQLTVGATKFFTKEDDGLAQEWHGRVWLNPPYAQPHIANFVHKMVEEFQSGRVTDAIMLTHNYTDTAWFHEATKAATAICFTRGRIRFYSPDGDLAAPTQGQAFFYFGSNIDLFASEFSGLLVKKYAAKVLNQTRCQEKLP